MVKFELEGKDYVIDDFMSIENYAKIYKIKDLFSDQYFAAKLINVITEAPIEDLMKCDYEQINYLASYILSLVPLDRNIPLTDSFEIDGVRYGFIPNWKDLSFAEFVDIDTISTKPQDQLLDLLHILAAIMYRPIEHTISKHNFLIEKYDIKTMVPRSELFKKKLNVKILLGAQFFFIKFAKRYSLYSRASSIKMSWKMKLKMIWKMRRLILQTIFRKPTGGMSSSIELLEMTLQNTTTSTKKM
jgi:hypothetical protein